MNGAEWTAFEADAILKGLILPGRSAKDAFQSAMPDDRSRLVVEVMFIDGALSGETRFVERNLLAADRWVSFSQDDALVLADDDTSGHDLRYRPVEKDGQLACMFNRFLLTFES